MPPRPKAAAAAAASHSRSAAATRSLLPTSTRASACSTWFGRRTRGDPVRQARRPSGHAYGLDMTDEMLALAARTPHEAGATNVTFLKGQIEECRFQREHRRRDLQLRDQSLHRQACRLPRDRARLKPGGRSGSATSWPRITSRPRSARTRKLCRLHRGSALETGVEHGLHAAGLTRRASSSPRGGRGHARRIVEGRQASPNPFRLHREPGPLRDGGAALPCNGRAAHEARSAGAAPGAATHPEVLAVLLEAGIDASDHVPTKLDDALLDWADVVVATSTEPAP